MAIRLLGIYGIMVILNNNIIQRGGNMENTENATIGIKQIIDRINNKEITTKQARAEYGINEKKFKKALDENGLVYNPKSRKYELITQTVGDEQKVTYRIPTELYKAIKLQAIFEGVNATDIIVKALNNYIPKSTKEIVEQNKK